MVLALGNEAHEFRQWLGQVILVVEHVDDLLRILLQHVPNLVSIILHANP